MEGYTKEHLINSLTADTDIYLNLLVSGHHKYKAGGGGLITVTEYEATGKRFGAQQKVDV